jgi:hypothetical protein
MTNNEIILNFFFIFHLDKSFITIKPYSWIKQLNHFQSL